LFTVCPKCTLTLVVTTVDLRAGQGYVRCGRCSNVFNALIALREGDPANGTSDTANRRLQETAPASVDPAKGVGVEMDPEPEPEPTPEPLVEEILMSSEGETSLDEPSLEFDPQATDVSEIFISADDPEQGASGTYEAVVLQVDPPLDPELIAEPASHTDTIASEEWSLLDDEPPADAESVIEESPLVAAAAAEDAGESEGAPADPSWVEEMFAEAEAQSAAKQPASAPASPKPAVRGGRRAADLVAAEPPAHEEIEIQGEPEFAPDDAAIAKPAPSEAAIAALSGTPENRRPAWQYIAGVSALALVFVLQIVHFNRQSLALSPTFGPAVAKVYGWLGATLTPRWDLTAYSVRQLGAESEGADGTRLRVRVSLQNESARVQPLPLLRLTLEDRFGNPVATRDLEPADYLPKRLADQRLLEPDQRIDAEVHVLDPGKTAMGFVIDACLRSASGGIGCTADARAQQPKRADG